MISRSDMRMIITAANREWMPAREKRREYFAAVREVLNSAEASERHCETALLCETAMKNAGWDLDLDAIQ